MIGYAFACLPPLLCVGLPLRYLLRNEWPRLRQMLFFPLAGQMRPGQNIQRARLLRRLNGVEVSLPTADGRVVHCVWAPGDAADRDGGPAVLLLHANAMVLDDMADWAAYYLNLGAGVLLLTYWGYPDPAEDFTARDAYTGEPLAADGRHCPDELSVYLDAEAALGFVLERSPVERTLVHGVSMGGGAASALGVRHPGLKVTVDQTFSTLHDVAINVGRGIYDQLVPKAPRSLHGALRCAKPALLWVACWLLLRMTFKTGRRKRGGGHAEVTTTGGAAGSGGGGGDSPPVGQASTASASEGDALVVRGSGSGGGPSSDECCALDRLDNVAKAAAITGDYFVFYAEDDEMMMPHFSPRLHAAHYGASNDGDGRIARIPGGHCAFFGEHKALADKYRKYLVSVGMCDSAIQ